MHYCFPQDGGTLKNVFDYPVTLSVQPAEITSTPPPPPREQQSQNFLLKEIKESHEQSFSNI